jgi:hypothetical protein
MRTEFRSLTTSLWQLKVHTGFSFDSVLFCKNVVSAGDVPQQPGVNCSLNRHDIVVSHQKEKK